MIRTASARLLNRRGVSWPDAPALPPLSKPASASQARAGFTFLEVLIAVALCSLTVAAVAATVTTVLAAEQLNERLQKEALVVRTFAARHHAPLAASDGGGDPGGWSAPALRVTTGEGKQAQEWDVLTLTAPDGTPGPRLAFRVF